MSLEWQRPRVSPSKKVAALINPLFLQRPYCKVLKKSFQNKIGFLLKSFLLVFFFVKNYFVSINSTLRLYHGLLRNKHNEILLELASGVRQQTLKLEKSNKQNRFQELHQPENHQLVKFVKIILFLLTRLCGSTTGF